MKTLFGHLNLIENFLNKYDHVFSLAANLLVAIITAIVGISSVIIALYTVKKTLNFEQEKQNLTSKKVMDVLDLETNELRRKINKVNIEFYIKDKDENEFLIDGKPFIYILLKEEETLNDIKDYIKLITDIRTTHLSEINPTDSNNITNKLQMCDSLMRRIAIYESYYNGELKNSLSKHLEEKDQLKVIRNDIQEFTNSITQPFSK